MQFFPPLAEYIPPYPVAPDGILPNSVLLGELRKSVADQQMAKNWKPPSLSLKQKNLMEEMQEVIFANLKIFLKFLWVSKNVIFLAPWQESEEFGESEEMDGETDLMDRLQAALAADTASSVPSPTPPPTPSPPSVVKRTIAPLKPIEKLVAPKEKERLKP